MSMSPTVSAGQDGQTIRTCSAVWSVLLIWRASRGCCGGGKRRGLCHLCRGKPMHNLMTMFGADTTADAIWITVGLLGQLMFTGRFIVQWIASEKAGRSVVPVAFWYFSILGGLIVLAYGIHKLDPVIILGQLPGVVIYSRNLWLIKKDADRRVD